MGCRQAVEADGKWLVGGIDDSSSDPATGEALARSEAGDALAKAYYNVQVGSPRDDVIGWMGEPTEAAEEDGYTVFT